MASKTSEGDVMVAGEPTVVRLDLDASTRDIAIARSVTAAMAARADLTLDQLEDARLAVDEAASQLVADCPAGARLVVEFRTGIDGLSVILSAPSMSGIPLSHDTFSWTVLSALTAHAEAATASGITRVELRIDRHAPVDA